MIFASVGSMLPFDRFVKGVDAWALANPSQEVFVQIGEGEYEPRHAPFARIVPHGDYARRLRACDLFVAHVGMGSIFQALEAKKQMLLLPRHSEWGEHTTDHQMATAARFGATPGLLIVDDIDAMHAAMTRLLAEPLAAGAGIAPHAPPAMIAKVASFLNTGAA